MKICRIFVQASILVLVCSVQDIKAQNQEKVPDTPAKEQDQNNDIQVIENDEAPAESQPGEEDEKPSPDDDDENVEDQKEIYYSNQHRLTWADHNPPETRKYGCKSDAECFDESKPVMKKVDHEDGDGEQLRCASMTGWLGKNGYTSVCIGNDLCDGDEEFVDKDFSKGNPTYQVTISFETNYYCFDKEEKKIEEEEKVSPNNQSGYIDKRPEQVPYALPTSMDHIYQTLRQPVISGGDPAVFSIGDRSDIDMLIGVERKLQNFVGQDIKEQFYQCTDNTFNLWHQEKVAALSGDVQMGLKYFFITWPITEFQYWMKAPLQMVACFELLELVIEAAFNTIF